MGFSCTPVIPGPKPHRKLNLLQYCARTGSNDLSKGSLLPAEISGFPPSQRAKLPRAVWEHHLRQPDGGLRNTWPRLWVNH